MNFKSIAIFLAGAAVGAVASYFFTKEKIEKRAQEDISAMEQVFKDKYEGIPCSADFDGDTDPVKSGEEFNKIAKECSNKKDSEEPTAKAKKNINYGRFEQSKQKILYNKPLKYDDANDTKKVRRKNNGMEPYIIDVEKFEELQNEDGWEAMEVNFDPAAAGNMYFYDNDGNEVSIDSVGDEAFRYLNNADPDEVVYVCNEELQMIFEITFDGVVPDFEDE
jgi:hypothetical protein